MPKSVLGQCTLVCNANVQVSLPSSGSYTVPIALLAPTASALCPGNLDLTIWTGPNQVVPNNILTCAHVGVPLTARVRHLATGNFCISEIEVLDEVAPTLNCASVFVSCSQSSLPSSIGYPVISDNCTPYNQLNINYFDNVTSLVCGSVQNGQNVLERIDRQWSVSDAWGNQSTCTQQIWVKAPELDSVVFPLNRDDISSPSLLCGQDPNDIELTGQPLLYGYPIENAGPCSMGITHTDQIISGCSPGSYTVLRNWLVVDFCTGQIRQRIQIVKIVDKIPPVLQVPDTLAYGTQEITCSANITLPNVITFDSCSSVSVVPNWIYGSGYGPFNNVLEGTYTLNWLATDACGNTATATSIVTVVDDKAPNVACAVSLQVSLGSNGQALVMASSINSGSWDNCGPVFLAVTRNDSVYASTVPLTCADENIPVMVRLRVTDVNGLSNYCDVPVTARDLLKPNLTCPPHITLNCLQDPYNLAITGQATASDNCSLQSLDFQNIGSLTGCNTGGITRRWLATDKAGNTRSCDQYVTVNSLSSTAVSFPPDVTLASCSNPIDITPAGTGTPVITGLSCFPLVATYTDQVFNISPPACFTVLRTWKVIDHCIYNLNGGTQGIWQKVQSINVVDQSAPLLQIPSDITLQSGTNNCDVYVQMPDATATDCSNNITISHNKPNGLSAVNASGWYGFGVHNIVFSASDGCGNSIQKILKITVRDEVIPTAICKNGLSVNIGSGGAIVLSPALFNNNSKDNCTPQDSLIFSINPPYFTCAHLGQQEVTLTVADKAGNTAQCQTYVIVQDNQPFCPRFTIEGDIRTPMGQPVLGVKLANGQGDSTYTDSTGHYKFIHLLPGKNYTISPSLLTNWGNGISAYDFVLISRHILGLEPMDTPEKIIAADANMSNTVTNFDIVQLRKVLMGTLPGVPGGKSWRFIDSNHVFTNTQYPFLPAFPEEIQFINLDSDKTNVNFKAIKLGDIDGTADGLNAQ